MNDNLYDTPDEKLFIHYFNAYWCDSCMDKLPLILKALAELGFDKSTMALHLVDEDKSEPAEYLERYDVFRVPTLVVLRNGKEIGRITEHPKTTFKDDLLAIIENPERR